MSSKYKYNIDSEFLDILDKEFDIKDPVERYASEAGGKEDYDKDEIAKRVFGDYGRNLAKRILELEGKYRDRVGEVIYNVAAKTGHVFPSVPQRFLEISFLGPRSDDEWTYKEISHKKLIHIIKYCAINQLLKKVMGEKEANILPCRYVDIGTCTAFYEGLNLNVFFKMTGELPKDGFCRFNALSV